MTSELKNCPFCDRDDADDNAVQESALNLVQSKSPVGGRRYRVECCCGATSRYEADPEVARFAWNTRTLSQTLPAPGEVPELECEYDPDGSYALIWKSGYAITAFPNGKVAITKSNRGDGFYPFGCDVSELTTLATVAAANDEAFARGVEAAAQLALEHAAPEGCERFDYDEACHDIAAAVRLLSQGGGK